MKIFLAAPVDLSPIADTLKDYAWQAALWALPVFAALFAISRMLQAFKIAVEAKAHAYHWAREAKESGDAAFTGWGFDGNTDGGKEFEAGGYQMEEIEDGDYQDRYSADSSAPESPESLERQWAMAGYDGNRFNPDGSEASHEDNAWRKLEWNASADPSELVVLNDGEINALYAGSEVSGEEMQFEVLGPEADDNDDELTESELAFAESQGWGAPPGDDDDETAAWERGEYN